MTPWNNNGRRHTGARRAQLSSLGHCCAVVLLICFVDKSTERSGVNGASAGPGTPTRAAQSWWQARVKSVTYQLLLDCTLIRFARILSCDNKNQLCNSLTLTKIELI